jgi:uncharacterized protein (DUF302 family)
MSSFGKHTRFEGTFEAALARVAQALKSEGFGVLTEIDVQGTLKNRLGVDFRRYKILGACNPAFAHRALSMNLDVGLLLPCNVIVYEEDDQHVHVAMIDPLQTLAAHGDPALAAIADEVAAKLGRALARIAEPD